MSSYAIVQASGKQFWIEEQKFYDFDKQIRDKKQPSPEMASRMIEMSKRVYSSCK